MRFISLIITFFIGIYTLSAQELFLFTYPASNVPKNTLVARGMNSFFKRSIDNSYSYHFMAEAEYGFTKQFMLVANSFFSNEKSGVNLEGGSVFGQYRFYSDDGQKKHFRMAAWSRVAFNNAKIHQEEIELNGHNSGIKVGVTATQLLHKTALSGTLSVQRMVNNINNPIPAQYDRNAVDYTFSFGQLILPKHYKNFSQTNFNFMVEILAQTLIGTGKSFIDIAPVFQFIFKSRYRLDLAYRHQIVSSMFRTQPNGVLLNFQYNFFNLIKRKSR
ncbi:MAG: hypothetical protein QM539_00785 [Alphaproteobacteria bacterium]|nr:hypothetical protein [Alphaproteobacteria bacterium]